MIQRMKKPVLLILAVAFWLDEGVAQTPDSPAPNSRTGFPTIDAPADSGTKTTYKILVRTDALGAVVDTNVVSHLKEPIKALAGFCLSQVGGLDASRFIAALGAGYQCSDRRKEILRRYLSADRMADKVIEEICEPRKKGSTVIPFPLELTIVEHGDSIWVDYGVILYRRGKVRWIEFREKYLFKDGEFRKVSSKKPVSEFLDGIRF